jgi:hypothetical protein
MATTTALSNSSSNTSNNNNNGLDRPSDSDAWALLALKESAPHEGGGFNRKFKEQCERKH